MNQLCKVCGESAAGFHFGAFTCEGCKSFFGRTYNNVSSLGDCKNAGRCIINKKNRTACKSCRLRKCILVGMSKSGSRYGRRSNWFKIHCLMEGSRSSSPPKSTSIIGSETSSCGRISEDEIDNAEVASTCALGKSPSRASSSPLLRSPTSPPRTTPELSIPESRALSITPEISMERMLDPGYLALYQRLSGVPLSFAEPPTYPFSPFMMPGFPSIRNPDYLLGYSQHRHLHRDNHELYDFKNNNEIRIQQYVQHPTTKDIRIRRDTLNNLSIKSGIKRPSESAFQLISPKRPKSEDSDNHEPVHERKKIIFNPKVIKWHENIEEKASLMKGNSPSELDCFPEEHPVDLSMKYDIQSAVMQEDEHNDNCGTALILDLSIKSRILKATNRSEVAVRSSSSYTIEDTTERELDDHQSDTPDGGKASEGALCKSVFQADEFETDDISTDHFVPSVSVTVLSERTQFPLNLSVKPITDRLLTQEVS